MTTPIKSFILKGKEEKQGMTVRLNLKPEIEQGRLAQGLDAGPEPSHKWLIDVLAAAPFAGSELTIQGYRPVDL